MRFLCLHGRGTNSKIFEMQTAAIRYELGDHHTYDFVEGNMPWEVDPAIKVIMPGEHEAFAYFDRNCPKSSLKALNDFNTFLETDGPYDGVIAFSLAVPLITSWMIHQVKQGKPVELTFKCAVFFSSSAPPCDINALQDERLVEFSSKEMGEIIDIPTVHIWGKTDPWAGIAKEVCKFCKSELALAFIHSGGHEIPGSGSEDAVTGSVNAIRRAVQLAEAAG